MNAGDVVSFFQKYGQPMAWLAIAGGAALGAVVFHLGAHLMTRGMTTRKLPTFAKNGARGVGGVVVGLLTALWVFQGGPGGPGGPGPGPGGPGQPADADHGPVQSAPDDHPTATAGADKDKDASPGGASSMHVRVLTGAELDSAAVGERRYYRLPDSANPQALHTLAEVKETIQQARDKQPPLKHLYIIGPDPTAAWVSDLQTWAKELGLKVDNLSPQ